MKPVIVLISLFLFKSAFAKPTLEGEPLFVSPSSETKKTETAVPEVEKTTEELTPPKRAPQGKRSKTSAKPIRESGASNLPAYFATKDSPNEAQIIVPSVTNQKLWNLKSGDEFKIEIPHSIIAFPDERAPVIATIKSGQFKGAKILGQSFLEMNSKRIFIDFFRITFNRETYDFVASAITDDGQTGFIGKHHSRELEYFAGDFSASFVAAYFDGLVPRYRTFLGEVDDTSVDSAVKKGKASGAMSTAERFREKLKRVPEFSELHGPIDGKLLVIDSEKGSRK